MKTGNRRQAGVLAIVAIGAVAFLVVQLFPGSSRHRLMAIVSAPDRETPKKLDHLDLPLVLVRDGFSHPKLGLAAKATRPSGVPSAGYERPLALVGGGFSPVLPDHLPPALDPSSLEAAPTAEVGTHLGKTRPPEENTGSSQQVKQATKPRLVLSAVVRAAREVALISIGGRAERAFRKGDSVVPGIKLMSISQEGISVKIGGEVRFVVVGDEIKW